MRFFDYFPRVPNRRHHSWPALVACMIAQVAAAAGIASDADYAAALDRETAGGFSRLLAEGETAASLAEYPNLVAAYTSLENALYDSHSPHANEFPAWYADRLADLDLDGLERDREREFFEAELASGDFDRTVHAYYILGQSRFALVEANVATPLWTRMIEVARGDPENRYWISLRLAESKLLPATGYERLHTKMASPTESVHQRLGLNADTLGPRISRILGLADADHRSSHPRIRYAQEAASTRVRKHELESLGADRAYQSIRDELEAMEKGEFQSRRFLALMKHDLPVLLDVFGLPQDPDSLLDSLELLCRGPGSNRMVLWQAAEGVRGAYAPGMAAVAEPSGPESMPDAETFLSHGPAAAQALAVQLADPEQREKTLHLFQADVIPSVVERRPPSDPAALRRAIRDAYYRLGYPPDQRAAYQRALDSLGPEELAQDQAGREKLAALAKLFDQARTADGFGRAFDDYRQARNEGRVPARDPSGAFVASFAATAVRILEAEASQARGAQRRAKAAREAKTLAATEIEAAEAAVVEANRLIREANQAVSQAEERQQLALIERNEVIRQLNAVVERANAALRARSADQAAARAEARSAERALKDQIESTERAYREATDALEAADQAGVDALNRARREQARAQAETSRENESLEAERAAETEMQRSQDRFAEVLGRLIAGLGLMGIHGDLQAIGDTTRDESLRLASVALVLEAETPPSPEIASAIAHERDGSSTLAKLAALAAARMQEAR